MKKNELLVGDKILVRYSFSLEQATIIIAGETPVFKLDGTSIKNTLDDFRDWYFIGRPDKQKPSLWQRLFSPHKKKPKAKKLSKAKK